MTGLSSREGPVVKVAAEKPTWSRATLHVQVGADAGSERDIA